MKDEHHIDDVLTPVVQVPFAREVVTTTTTTTTSIVLPPSLLLVVNQK